jgi:thiol-disulfide isomerase/thioredoxin
VSDIAISVGPLALSTPLVLLLICALVAAAVGGYAGRRQKTRIGASLTDMLLLGGLAARIAFVATWFGHYRSAPWSILDIRDGGFTPWVAVLAAVLVALWQGWRRAALRAPLLLGLLAASVIWLAAPTVLRLGDGPTLAQLKSIQFTSFQGAPASLPGAAQGRPLVINLWATWCPPCRREMPVLAAAQQRLPGVSFVFVNQGEDSASVQKYLVASQLVLANVLLDPGKALGQRLGSLALPTTLFFDAAGHLVETHLGALSAASLASKLEGLATAVAARPAGGSPQANGGVHSPRGNEDHGQEAVLMLPLKR